MRKLALILVLLSSPAFAQKGPLPPPSPPPAPCPTVTTCTTDTKGTQTCTTQTLCPPPPAPTCSADDTAYCNAFRQKYQGTGALCPIPGC